MALGSVAGILSNKITFKKSMINFAVYVGAFSLLTLLFIKTVGSKFGLFF